MSKRLMALLAILAVVALYSVVNLHAADMAMSSNGSWTGEVVDVACYAAKGAKGTGHQECGAKCVKAGLPVGLLVGDTVYLLIGADHKPMNDQLAEHVTHTVTVTGEKFESKGANVIAVKDFKMASGK